MMLDFTVLAEYEQPVVIHCPEEKQADFLLSEMFRQYPQLVANWRRSDTHWDYYGTQSCYAPHIYDTRSRDMQFSPPEFWAKHGYTIVPFENLLCQRDLGAFECELSIDSLF